MIKAIDAEQDEGATPSLPSLASVQFSPQASDPHPSPSEVTPADIPLLTREEKRRILARIARVNPMDCFDESGTFDIARAKRVLPPGAVRHIAIHETTRLNAEGQPVTQRRINVRLVDPVSALRLDDLMERQREPRPSHSGSNSKNFSRKDFNLLTEKTMALDDANQSIELLKKALAEADDRELRLSKELDEKDHQPEVAKRIRELTPASTSQSTNSQAHQSQDQTREAGFSTPLSGSPAERDSQPLGFPKGEAAAVSNSCSSVSGTLQTLNNVECDTLSEAERIAKKRKASAARSFEREIEYVKNTSGHGAFCRWLRSRGIDPAKYRPEDPSTYQHAIQHGQPARPPARPPPP